VTLTKEITRISRKVKRLTHTEKRRKADTVRSTRRDTEKGKGTDTETKIERGTEMTDIEMTDIGMVSTGMTDVIDIVEMTDIVMTGTERVTKIETIGAGTIDTEMTGIERRGVVGITEDMIGETTVNQKDAAKVLEVLQGTSEKEERVRHPRWIPKWPMYTSINTSVRLPRGCSETSFWLKIQIT
jgi:hypothetical protein